MNAQARWAGQEHHQRMIDAAAVFLDAVTQLVSETQPGEDPAQQQACTAVQSIVIALGQRHGPDGTVPITDGVGLGIGAVLGSTCAAQGVDPGPLTQRLATAMAHGLLAGAVNAKPAGRA